jgi:hypothetical protein
MAQRSCHGGPHPTASRVRSSSNTHHMFHVFLRRLAVRRPGSGSPGPITLARNDACGKSLGFRVTMKSASPNSAQSQMWLSSGSGERLRTGPSLTRSPLARSVLTIFPMRGRRTPSLASTSLYSSRISSLISQTNVRSSTQRRTNLALAMFVWWIEPFIPATPATNTDVSTTPLDLRRFSDNGYLRLCLLGGAVLANGALNVLRRNVADILRSLFQSGQKLCFPVEPLSSPRQITI